MKKMKALAMMTMLTFSATNAFSYDVVDRFKLIDDKLKTEQMLNPIGHDFFLDIGVTLNKDAKTFVNDVKDASKFQGALAAKLSNAQSVLAKYDKTEQTVKINANLGFPIFSFHLGELKVRPNIRALVDGGANVGIRSDKITADTIFDLVNVSLPEDFKSLIRSKFNAYLKGDDITNPTGPGGSDLCADPSLSVSSQAACVQAKNQYFFPDPTIPDMFLFAKVDARVGFFNEYEYGEHFFGNWNLYGLSRTDIFQRVNASMIANGTKVDLPKTKNTETTLLTDYRIGYKNSNYHVFASVEDIKLSTISKRKQGSKVLSYGYDPLMRLHADALYRWSALSINPFLGFHKRKGYGFADGVYLGTDLGAHVWGDRLGLQFRGMVDKQYFTISPRVKLWLMSLEYSLKAPMKSMDGDVKLSAINSIDLRLFF